MDAPFWLDDWYVDPVAGSLLRDGAEIRLEPKVMTVLLVLASRAGEVISREEIEELAWPGVVVGYDALASSIIKLRKALGDDSRHPRYIETVPKRGYRLIAPTGAAGQKPDRDAVSPSRFVNRPVRYAVMGLAIVLAVGVAITLWFSGSGQPPAEPVATVVDEIPTIAVLPFSNLGDDPAKDYLSDGLTEDLIIDLSRFSGVRVIARRSSFTYKTQTVSLQKLSEELGARYVLEGSVRHDRDRLRITVQLVDAQSGINLWADRFDREFDELLDVQDEVRKKIFQILSVKLTGEEQARERSRYTASFEAYDYFQRGQASLVKRSTSRDYQHARELLQNAVRLDPEFARAYSALALAHADAYRFGWGRPDEDVAKLANEAGERAIELDSNLPQAYWVMGYIQLYVNGDHKKAISLARRCIELAPSNADGYALLAVTNVFLGEPEKAIRLVNEAMRLNPHYPSMYPSVLGQAYLVMKDAEQARNAFEESLTINPARLQGNIYMIVTLVRLGELDEASWQAEEFKLNNPEFDPEDWVRRQAFRDNSAAQAMLEDMVKAGL